MMNTVDPWCPQVHGSKKSTTTEKTQEGSMLAFSIPKVLKFTYTTHTVGLNNHNLKLHGESYLTVTKMTVHA
jgi:hypothetical protein